MKSAQHNGASNMSNTNNDAAEHTYTVAGTSVQDGVNTYRFANTLKRAAVLARNGHTNVVLMELPRAMVLKDAVAFLKAQGVYAELPYGQRRGQNGRSEAAVVVAAVQLDAHVQAHAAAMAEKAAKAADFVARMAAARAAKKLQAA
jgi:hypothetical protein